MSATMGYYQFRLLQRATRRVKIAAPMFTKEDQKRYLESALRALQSEFGAGASGGGHWVYLSVADRGLCVTIEALIARENNMRVALLANKAGDIQARQDAEAIGNVAASMELPEGGQLDQTSTASGRAYGFVWTQQWPPARELLRAMKYVRWWNSIVAVEAPKLRFKVRPPGTYTAG